MWAHNALRTKSQTHKMQNRRILDELNFEAMWTGLPASRDCSGLKGWAGVKGPLVQSESFC